MVLGWSILDVLLIGRMGFCRDNKKFVVINEIDEELVKINLVFFFKFFN